MVTPTKGNLLVCHTPNYLRIFAWTWSKSKHGIWGDLMKLPSHRNKSLNLTSQSLVLQTVYFEVVLNIKSHWYKCRLWVELFFWREHICARAYVVCLFFQFFSFLRMEKQGILKPATEKDSWNCSHRQLWANWFVCWELNSGLCFSSCVLWTTEPHTQHF